MSRYRIDLSFDGSTFHGWQIQNNAHSVQAELNEALSIQLQDNIFITGAGRTDRGVHASHMVAHFDTTKTPKEHIVYSLNAVLPSTISIHSLCRVEDDFHARFNAKSRTYRYHIHTFKNPFLYAHSLYYPQKINLHKLKKASNYLLGEQEFSSFCKSRNNYNNYNCHITKAEFKMQSEGEYVFEIKSNRFLRGMVRTIVGTLLLINKPSSRPEEIKDIIRKKNRTFAGKSVKPHGLFLTNITY